MTEQPTDRSINATATMRRVVGCVVDVPCECGNVMSTADVGAVGAYTAGRALRLACDHCGVAIVARRQLIEQANTQPNRHARRIIGKVNGS